jgi:phenylglyoxylate dehydrogenase beta subunit
MDTALYSLRINQALCTGCRLCELACSVRTEQEYDVTQSRVQSLCVPEDAYCGVYTCRQCGEPACIPVCPTQAISKSEEDGVVRVDAEKCVGCMLCTMACPYSGIRYSEQAGKALKCDLCDGDPECAKWCPTGAIELSESPMLYAALRDKEDMFSPGLSACLGCSAEMAMRTVMRVLGPNSILAIPPGCMGGVGAVGYGTTTGAKVPIFFPLLDNIASMLAGIKTHYQRAGRDVQVVAFAGDGGTADVGFQCLSGAAERGDNILYICYDNEGYMNTGVQRSGTTPFGAWTSTTPVGSTGRGKSQKSKDMPMILAMHDVPYVATANLAYMADAVAKIQRAAEVRDGLAYIHLFCPCPIGWRFPTERGVEVSRMAVKTGFFPLWEAVAGKFRMTVDVGFRRPIQEYTGLVGKYSHLNQEELRKMQAIVDDRFRRIEALAGTNGEADYA